MTDYTKLVKALRWCSVDEYVPCKGCPMDEETHGTGCFNIMHQRAAAAIEALQAEIRESMQKCAECGDEQEQKVKELQARLGEAENSAERWKDMYLTKHEPKQGEWELIDGAEPMRWGCSRCKYMSWETSNYCPRCGAKMEVQE